MACALLFLRSSSCIAKPETAGGRIWHHRGRGLPEAAKVSLLKQRRWLRLPRHLDHILKNRRQALAASCPFLSRCSRQILCTLGALPKHPFLDHGALKTMLMRHRRDARICHYRLTACFVLLIDLCPRALTLQGDWQPIDQWGAPCMTCEPY